MNTTERSFGPPTFGDILVPPFVGLALMLAGILIYSLAKQPGWWKHRFCKNSISNQHTETHVNHCQSSQSNSTCFELQAASDDVSIYTCEDLLTVNRLRMFQNNPLALLKLSIPAFISVGVCPITIIFQGVMIDFFYPKYIGGRINTNDSLAVFLLPAGLVYAMAFGFALQDALAKLDVTSSNAGRHLSILKQCQQLIGSSNTLTSEQKMAAYKHLCQCTTQWLRRQMTSRLEKHSGQNVFKILHILQSTSPSNAVEAKILESLFDKMMELDSVMTEGYTGAGANINVIQWAFMEMLGFIAFFGILLVVAHSYRLELTMCILTVFSISAFVFILSDLDYAYHGTFIVDLSVFVLFLEGLNEQYQALHYKEKDAQQNS